MFAIDLLISYLLMALLFLRQLSILRDTNKINYAPLILAIGVIAGGLHIVLASVQTPLIVVLQEALTPLITSFGLFTLLTLLQQTQKREIENFQLHNLQKLSTNVEKLKEFIQELETKLILMEQKEHSNQEDIRQKFRQDIKALDTIEHNQNKFLQKFEEIKKWHEEIQGAFEHFISKELPEVNSVLHKHIDLFRVSEQEHYLKISTMLNKAIENRYDIQKDVDELKEKLEVMRGISTSIADSIVKATQKQLAEMTKAFERELINLKSHAEGVNTNLYESESKLESIKGHSEILMRQMALSSKKMGSLEEYNNSLLNLYSSFATLLNDVESIKSDYVKSQAQLHLLAEEIKGAEGEHLEAMRGEIEQLSDIVTQKVDESLGKLHEHYHIASEDITQSVKVLAKKAQLRGYMQN